MLWDSKFGNACFSVHPRWLAAKRTCDIHVWGLLRRRKTSLNAGADCDAAPVMMLWKSPVLTRMLWCCSCYNVMEISSFNEDVVVAVMSERERYCTFVTCAGYHNPPPPSLVVDFSARKALKFLANQLEFIAQQ